MLKGNCSPAKRKGRKTNAYFLHVIIVFRNFAAVFKTNTQTIQKPHKGAEPLWRITKGARRKGY